MMRPATMAAIALGFLTALVVGQLGLLMPSSDIDSTTASIQVNHTEPVVEAFYMGVNAWIATGDRSLERLIAPGFVDHTGSGAPDRSGSELFDQLSAIGAALPSLHFEILDIEAGGTIVSVELLGVSGRFPTIDGWSIALPAQQSFREILRIDENRVAERWSPDDLWPSGSPSVELDLSVGCRGLPATFAPAVHPGVGGRVRPHRRREPSCFGSSLVSCKSSSPDGTRPELSDFQPSPFAAGTMRLVEPTGSLRVRALGGERVELWTVSLDTILVNEPSTGSLGSDLPSGIRQDASVSLSTQLPANGVRLLVHIVTLPVGATLSTSAASLHEVAVVGGALRAEPETGEVFYCFDRARSRLLTGPQTALPGQGFANSCAAARRPTRSRAPNRRRCCSSQFFRQIHRPPNPSALALAERSRRSLEDVSGLS